MSSFTTPLDLRALDDGKTFQIINPFRYRIGSVTSKNIIAVPNGFKTDFASVPRILWSILPPWGKYGKAAVLHDYLYFSGKFSRKECDKIFLEAMKEIGVGYITRTVIYSGVRIGGWAAWNKHRGRDNI